MAGNVGTLFYVANKVEYQNCFACDEYAILKNEYTNANDIIDYNNWGISFGRRWNSLKFFYIIKTFGKKGL
jgi:tyrosine decarboxylase/aromatic-L-amino-acid decarboxylase